MGKQSARMLIISWCVLATLSSTSFAADSPSKSLGFTVLAASGIDTDVASRYSTILRNALVEAGAYAPLDFSDVAARLAEQGFSDQCTKPQCAIMAGQILGVEFFGFGRVESIGKAFTINMQIIEVRTGRMVADLSEFHRGNRVQFEQRVIPRLAQRISGIEPQKRGR